MEGPQNDFISSWFSKFIKWFFFFFTFIDIFSDMTNASEDLEVFIIY